MANETFGAIDRINKPQVIGIRLGPAGLLAIETMRREPVENDVANRFLAFDIGLCDRRPVRLGRHREVTVVVTAADIRSGFRGVERGSQVVRSGAEVERFQWSVAFSSVWNGVTMAGRRQRNKRRRAA